MYAFSKKSRLQRWYNLQLTQFQLRTLVLKQNVDVDGY